MANRFDILTQQVFQKNIEDCTVEELQTLANDYPYFAPAQYSLLVKLKEDAAYGAQLQKAILYYHDPLTFDQFLNAEDNLNYDILQETFLPVSETEKTDLKNLNKELEVQKQHILKEQIVTEKNREEEILDGEITQKEPDKIIEVENRIIENEIRTAAPENIDTNTELAFEPFHTVDYFASQGIKLSQEEAAKDKIGKQLKSFTEWLKTMKKLPASEQVKSLDVRTERNIENLAAHSVEGEEVYTETMAEVWAQQGNREKAIDIYNKLSLLNPSKRAYFAAKIDSLK